MQPSHTLTSAELTQNYNVFQCHLFLKCARYSLLKYKTSIFLQVTNFTDISMSISFFLNKILPLKINIFKLPNCRVRRLNPYNFTAGLQPHDSVQT